MLNAGTKLGPYEILAPLGAGGMGEVYRALDARLDREVAIKVSQERFSDRFEREAPRCCGAEPYQHLPPLRRWPELSCDGVDRRGIAQRSVAV